MRSYVRHSSDMPIEIIAEDLTYSDSSIIKESATLHDLSIGGLCCFVGHYIPQGTPISIRIPAIQTDYRGYGISSWCKKSPFGYTIGISFADKEQAFNYRMVKQIYLIERYRLQILSEQGRSLSSEQAAHEWIKRYAADF